MHRVGQGLEAGGGFVHSTVFRTEDAETDCLDSQIFATDVFAQNPPDSPN